MNTCAQPAEGAGGSRSRAAGELMLGLLSGEKRRVYADLPLLFCRSCGAAIRLASEGGLSADQFLSNVPSPTVAAEGCDLLLLFVMNKAKRSQPRCTRQRLQGNAHA
ncbi:hypothetical protein EMIT0196MI5_50311 [Pseudomonas sp. IT-196MI5]